MNANAEPGRSDDSAPGEFRLAYRSLSGQKGCAFPCDARGDVAINELTESVRIQYLAARALVGRLYERPVIERVPATP